MLHPRVHRLEMAVIDPYRAAAVKALLARIDNNRNQYNSKPKQNDMLRDLIKSNNLETYVGRGGQQLAGLTVERFHKIIEDVTKRHVRGNKDARSNSTHLFEQGSAVVEAAYLDKIGYSGECEEAANGAIELSSDDDISDIEIPTKKRKHAASNKQEKKIRQQTKMLQETDRDSSDPSAEVSGLGNSRKRKDGPSSSRSEEPRKKTKMTEELTANPSEQIVDPNFAAIINGNANGDTRKCKAGPFDFNEDEHRKKMRMTADSEVNSPEVIGNRDSAANADENVAGVQSNTDTNKVASMVSPAQEPAINRPSADVSHPRSGIDTSSSTLTTAALPSTTTVPTTAIPMTTIPTAIAQNADNEASGLKRRAADSADEARDPKKQKTGAEPENSSQTRSAAAQTDLDDPYALKDPRMRIVVEGIESRDLLQKLDVLAHKSQGFGLQVLIRTGKEWTAAAEWVPNPSNELRDLYRRALGNAWEDQALVLSQSGEFKAYELIQALITAEWDKILFHEKLPWPSPREMTEAMAHIEPYFDAMNAEQGMYSPLWCLGLAVMANQVCGNAYTSASDQPLACFCHEIQE